VTAQVLGLLVLSGGSVLLFCCVLAEVGVSQAGGITAPAAAWGFDPAASGSGAWPGLTATTSLGAVLLHFHRVEAFAPPALSFGTPRQTDGFLSSPPPRPREGLHSCAPPAHASLR